MIIKIIKILTYTLLAITTPSYTFADNNFQLSTDHFVKHQPTTDTTIKASLDNKTIPDHATIDTHLRESTEDSLYCTQNKNRKRRSLTLQNDEQGQNFLTVRGGLLMQYTNCKNGNNGQIKIKRRAIKAFYQIKF